LLLSQFHQVDSRHLAFDTGDFDRVFQVDHAERASGDDHIRAGFSRHANALRAHALLFFRLVEEHQAAATAAERALAAALHLDALEAGNRIEHGARVIVDVIVPAQIGGSWRVSRRLAARDSGTKAIDEHSFYQRLAEIAFDPQTQHALLDAVIRVRGDEDRWDQVPSFGQMFVKLDTRHCRHMNISYYAGRGSEFGGCEEFGGRRKYRNSVVQRLKQSSHGVAKGPVVIDDRDQ